MNFLDDVTVIDFTTLLPGPFCTQILADLGANVLKVERPTTGDLARGWDGGLFSAANRNKSSVTLDLRSAEGLEVALELIESADVVVENFRPGVMERFGLGFDDVALVRPQIVYCSISGFGQSGPRASEPGHDGVYLAAAGALSFSGSWERTIERPGVPLGDLAAATNAAVAILAALRRRDRSGRGARLDVAITDSALAWATPRAGARFEFGGERQDHLSPTNSLFETADGSIVALAALEDHFWHDFVEGIGPHEPQLRDERFATHASRVEHGDELFALLSELFRRETAEVWLDRLAGRDVPFDEVNTVKQAVASEQIRYRGIVEETEEASFVLFPALCDGKPMGELRHRPPELGESYSPA